VLINVAITKLNAELAEKIIRYRFSFKNPNLGFKWEHISIKNTFKQKMTSLLVEFYKN